ncbi:MAG TPA: YdcF family protein [Candidatus Hydrogenedentes bacterium]|nr:YdcF family protein [Candidatus Hydrogenedentota bacterium]HPJ98590.1 YdcF family protein [Candidatus Hydrogenedentota bacterium]
MRSNQESARRRIFGCIAAVFLVGCAWFAAHTAVLIWRGLAVDARNADAIVVLGNKVEQDGTPSPRLQRRLDCAARLHQEGLAPVIIVSGGLGREGHPEAEVMREALIASGVPANAILVDNDGTDTFCTARNAKHMLTERGLESVIIVSSFYHLLRSRMIFARFGFDEISSAHAPLAWEWRDAYSVVREFPAFYYYRLRSIEK